MAVKCVLGCGELCPENSDIDICVGCRKSICDATRNKTDDELKARGVKLDVYKARNVAARDHSPDSYLEQLLTKRKLRQQQEQRHDRERRNRHRSARARA